MDLGVFKRFHGVRGVASQKVMERQACPHETLKIIHDCKKQKANDPMGG